MAKAKQRFSWTYNHEAGEVTAKDIILDKSVTWALKDVGDIIRDRIAVYGLGKVLQDRTSQDDADTKLNRMVAVFSQLLDGKWKSDRTGGGFGIVPAHIEVVAAKRGWTGTSGIAKAQKAWKATSEETRAELLTLWDEEITAIKEARSSADEVKSLDDMLS